MNRLFGEMSKLPKEERETVISIDASNRETCIVYSSDPVYQRKLEKIGAEIIHMDDWGKHYRLPANQVSLRKARKPLTEEQKEAAAERLKSTRALRG